MILQLDASPNNTADPIVTGIYGIHKVRWLCVNLSTQEQGNLDPWVGAIHT